MVDMDMARTSGPRMASGGLDTSLMQTAMLLAGLALGVFIVFPRTAPFDMLVMAAPLLALVASAQLTWTELRRVPLAAVTAFGGYLVVNATWAQQPGEAIGKAALFLVLAGALWVSCRALSVASSKALSRWARVALVTFVAVLAYLVFEEVTRHLIKRVLFNALPFIRPDEKHIQLDGTLVTNVYLYVSNRSMAAMTLTLWPVLLWIMHGRPWSVVERYRWAAAVLLVVVAGWAISMSQHETSGIALVLSLIAVGLWAIAGRWAIAMVAAAWAVSTLLVIVIASQAYTQQKLHLATWLPETARHRIIIWGYTAEQIPKAPLFGIGIDSGKVLDAKAVHEKPADHLYPRRTGTHSHNVYVQTWYDLGAVGAVLLCVMGLSILLAISRLTSVLQPYALATFVASAAMAGFSWGMWQPWFMASFGIAALLFLVAAELARRTPAATSR